MPNGSKIEIYAGDTWNLAFRTTNPGIKSDPGGAGVIGYIPKTIDGHTYQYPVYATPKDAQNATLRILDGYNAKGGGDLTVADVFGGKGKLSPSATYYKDKTGNKGSESFFENKQLY